MQEKILQARKEHALRELARRDLKTFILLKWQRYEQKEFLDNWHFDYLSKILESTIPKTTQDNKLITRAMINMPPSYGKTETIARCFIAWALGNDRTRKFIYISYSDELCRKISAQVRDLIKSNFWQSIFKQKASFLQDNSSEFLLNEGGGLFVTTLKSALTGFHADCILIDDPIKVSAMISKTERNLVNQNFKESVQSRLMNTKSSIIILMQRLGEEDLCGFLTNPREFSPAVIDSWKQIKLQAINKEPQEYKIKDFTYFREANEPLFAKKHDKAALDYLKLQMGEDEFFTQYQQEPQAREAGYFESEYFKIIPQYELGSVNYYIFVDNAMSLNAASDNRAIVVLGVDRIENLERYSVFDCFYGIWSEEETIENLLNAMSKYPSAKVYIESDGGGLTLHRLTQKAIVAFNEKAKRQNKPLITNILNCYTPSRKVAKVDKIKAIRSYYNTGFLVFVKGANGLEQIKKELLAFNPAKPFRKDDCIDCIASCVAHSEIYAAIPAYTQRLDKTHRASFIRASWNI